MINLSAPELCDCWLKVGVWYDGASHLTVVRLDIFKVNEHRLVVVYHDVIILEVTVATSSMVQGGEFIYDVHPRGIISTQEYVSVAGLKYLSSIE